jgi:hypothetical protein
MSGASYEEKESAVVCRDETPATITSAATLKEPATRAAAQNVAAPKADAPQPETRKLDSRTPMLSKLLSIGDIFRAENSIRQAISIYFDLAEKHSGTPEAYDALERLLDIAAQYEDAGEIRQALSLYERLL